MHYKTLRKATYYHFLKIDSKPLPKKRESGSTIHTKGRNCFINNTHRAVKNGTIQYLISTYNSYYITVLMLIYISKLIVQTI